MAFTLPIKRRSGLLTTGVDLNANSRVDITTRAGALVEIVNVPDALPVAGGKFPITGQDLIQVYIPFIGSGSGGIVEETIAGVTPGDAHTRGRVTVPDGEPWRILARITNTVGEAYTYQAFGSLTVQVQDLSTGSANVYTGAPTLAAVVTTTLMAWDVDAYGYNVDLTILPSELSTGMEGTHALKAELAFALNSGGNRIVESWAVIRSEGAV